MRKNTPIGAMQMTQVVMVIMASDKQVKKSKRGFPRSSIMAKVTPKNTAMRHTETFNKPNRKQLFICLAIYTQLQLYSTIQSHNMVYTDYRVSKMKMVNFKELSNQISLFWYLTFFLHFKIAFKIHYWTGTHPIVYCIHQKNHLHASSKLLTLLEIFLYI